MTAAICQSEASARTHGVINKIATVFDNPKPEEWLSWSLFMFVMIHLSTFSRRFLAPLALALTVNAQLSAEELTNTICPIMTEDEADIEAKVSYQGKDIYFCCSPCVKQFKADPDYYVKVFQDMKTVPVVQDITVPGDIQLLEQRFCPFSEDRLVGPKSPSADYKGVKVYFSKPGHLKTWESDPDGYAKKAVEKGLLPQLKGKV